MLGFEEFNLYCNSLPGVNETFPFGPETLVFKVFGKIFALCSIKNLEQKFIVNLKCQPEKSITLREKYSSIYPGYHMNKKHWISVDVLDGEIPKELFFDLIDNSYNLVSGGSVKLK